MLRLPIDHVVLLVADLEAAGSACEAAGFTVTPKASHSAAMGTANRCIMLAGSYIEIMAIETETPANLAWRRLLQQGRGIRGLAFRSADIEASGQNLTQAGIATEPVRHFSRETPEGDLRFSVVRIDPSETPGLQCLVCQHHTADILWQADSMNHANRAAGLDAVELPSIAGLEQLGAALGDDGTTVETGAGKLVLSGRTVGHYDLTDSCGIEIVVVRP